LNGDIVIYPDQSLVLCGFICEMESQVPLPRVKLKAFAENVIPRESEIWRFQPRTRMVVKRRDNDVRKPVVTRRNEASFTQLP